MQERNLFEIPIYRSDGDDLLRAFRSRHQRQNTVSDFFGVEREKQPVLPGRRYNDVVGWIVLSIWVGRIRAEYWFVEQRVRAGLRNKTFESRGKLFVYNFATTIKDSTTVYGELFSLLKASAAEEFPKRQVDYECFESTGPYLDWAGLLKRYASNKPSQTVAAKARR